MSERKEFPPSLAEVKPIERGSDSDERMERRVLFSLGAACAKYGATLPIEKGNMKRTESPVASARRLRGGRA